MFSVQHLGQKLGGQTILRDVNFQIARGERVGLVGASGSGKSTLAHCLVTRRASTGLMRFDLGTYGRITQVPQSPSDALDPLRTLAFHWRQAERALGLPKDDQRAIQRLTQFGLTITPRHLKQRPWQWSRGMQQRFVIAMALLGQPDLLILDEPTSALDPTVAALTLESLKADLSEHEISLLLITHDLGLAAKHCERLLVMDRGRIVEQGPTHRLLEQPQTEASRHLLAHRHWTMLPC